MTYGEALNFIHSRERFGSCLGLLRIQKLLKELGDPQDGLKYIHIAGTNGKGSTSTMLSEIMISEGYKTGLFTSPYVEDFCERIQIDGKMIPHGELAALTEAVEPAVKRLDGEGICPTEFEVVTAIAFLYFKMQGCDIVILEVGLGGRLDSTNVIKAPLASVITSISLDHTDIIGSTVCEIAREKSGIIKDGGVTVVYPEMDERALGVIAETAAEKNNVLRMGNIGAVKILSEDIFGTRFQYGELQIFVPLSGRYQVCNAVNAIEAAVAVRSRGFNVSDKSIAEGIGNTKIPARMEIISKKPLVLLDGGHNEGASEVVFSNLKSNVHGDITAIMGFMADKDYETYISRISPLLKKIIVTEASNPRRASEDELFNCASRYLSDVVKCREPKKAAELAKSELSENETLLVCGSLYLASDIREHLIELFS